MRDSRTSRHRARYKAEPGRRDSCYQTQPNEPERRSVGGLPGTLNARVGNAAPGTQLSLAALSTHPSDQTGLQGPYVARRTSTEPPRGRASDRMTSPSQHAVSALGSPERAAAEDQEAAPVAHLLQEFSTKRASRRVETRRHVQA